MAKKQKHSRDLTRPIKSGSGSIGQTPERIAAVLLEARTQGEAARELGVTASTMSRWARRDDVRAALRQTGQAALAAHVERSKIAADKALRVLEELMGTDHEPTVRRAAAHDVLAHVSRAAVLGADVDDRQAATLSPLQRLQAALCGASGKTGAEGEGADEG